MIETSTEQTLDTMEVTIAAIDSIPISDLEARYDLGRSAVNNRIRAAEIKPERRGKRSFISQSQLEILDQQHMQTKNGMPLTIPGSIELQSQVEPPNLFDVLMPYKVLQEVVDRQWVLTTAIVRLLIGAKPHGRRYQKLGFVFERTDRIDEWFVSKVDRISAAVRANCED